ncbi:hypothetical protein ACP70R_010685 [Stipagrostis hirtigluma subsp. patula]
MDIHPHQPVHHQQGTYHLRLQLAAQYGIPAALLLSNVPPVLQAVEDHVVFPFSDVWPHRRWIRVSNLMAFWRSCFTAREVLAGKTLTVFVMPYMSLRDAYALHQMVDNPSDFVAPSTAASMAENDENEDGVTIPVPGRHGFLMVVDPDDPAGSEPIPVAFDIYNYGLLKCKADQHEQLAETMTEIEKLIGNLNHLRDQIYLDCPSLSSEVSEISPEMFDELEAASQFAQEELIVSVYMHGLDPHDLILDIDSDAHDNIYDAVSDPCINLDAPPYEQIDELTKDRLGMFIGQLVMSGHHIRKPRYAKSAVLAAEGEFHAKNLFSNSSKGLQQALDKCYEDLRSLFDEINIADTRHSLLGVKSVEGGILQNPPFDV